MAFRRNRTSARSAFGYARKSTARMMTAHAGVPVVTMVYGTGYMSSPNPKKEATRTQVTTPAATATATTRRSPVRENCREHSAGVSLPCATKDAEI